MSHFVVLALVDRTVKADMKSLEKAVTPLLAPYDENMEVKQYKKECYCVGLKAKKLVGDKLNKKYGSIDSLREVFDKKKDVKELRKKSHELHTKWMEEKRELTKKAKDALSKEIADVEGKLQQLWQAHIHLEEREKEEGKLFEEHPKRHEAKPDCEDCKGTGQMKTTRNPKSKWDWWCVGGRWTGFLDFTGYDPEKDPDNYETCFLCQGTGKRNDELGQKERKKNPKYTCNGCSGTGKSLKFSLKPVGYAATVLEILARQEIDKSLDITPFAIVTEDQWYERGEMGWFACVGNEKKHGDWKKETREILKQHVDKVAVVVDCHI